MTDRNRRILGWVLLLAGIAMLGYVAVSLVLMARGELGLGPLRVVTLLLNAGTGIALLWLGRISIRG